MIRLYFSETHGARHNVLVGIRSRDAEDARGLHRAPGRGLRKRDEDAERFRRIADPYHLAVALEGLTNAFSVCSGSRSRRASPALDDPDTILNILFKGLLCRSHIEYPGGPWMEPREDLPRPLKRIAVWCSSCVGLRVGRLRRRSRRRHRPSAEVAVVTVQTQPVVLTTELPGRTSAYRIAEIRPQVNGIIQKRLFTEGSDVKAGQVLYQIDPAPFQAALDNAKAALARAEANLPAIRLAGRALQGAARRQGGQPAGLRRRRRRAEAGRGRGRVLEGGGGDRPHQPGLHPDHRAHLRPHRQVQRDRRRPRDRVPAAGRWRRSSSSTRSTWTCPSPPPSCCALQRRLKDGRLEAGRRTRSRSG